jgi:polysaccharide export outer membrane protein
MFTSCGVPKNFQHVAYFADSITEAEQNIINTPVLIEPGDRLNISITAINKEAADAFNMSAASGSTGQEGYLVDSLGNIQLLQLGVVNVKGLTTSQLASNLQKELAAYIKGPVVTVSITNFKINVFGEVGKAGVINVPDGKMTILEALIQSGDLGMYGRHDNVLVIREENGKREFGRVNINSNHVFESPYFNLKQNDIIYVETDKTKYILNDAVLQRNLRNFGIGLTLLTTTLLLVNLFKN